MSEVDFSNKVKQFLGANCPQKLSFGDKLKSILKTKAEEQNFNSDVKVSFEILRKIYWRGARSFEKNHANNTTRAQWALCRVNSFLKLLRGSADANASYSLVDLDLALKCENFPKLPVEPKESPEPEDFSDFSPTEFALAHVDLVRFNINKDEQNQDDTLLYYSKAEFETLDKPFLIYSESLESPSEHKEFGVFVKSLEKGKTILVKFKNRPIRASYEFSDKTDPMYWSSKFWEKTPINKFVSSDALEWDEDEILSEWRWDIPCLVDLENLFKINPDLKKHFGNDE
jgi:hypothetical protein